MASVVIFDSRDFVVLGALALGVYAHAPWWLLALGLGWLIFLVESRKEVR